jgi:hypothetical protein
MISIILIQRRFFRDVKLFVRDKNNSRKLAKKLIKKGLLIRKFLFFKEIILTCQKFNCKTAKISNMASI